MGIREDNKCLVTGSCLFDNHSFFSPEDFKDEEELISRTTEQFVKNDIIPKLESIEQHDYNVTRKLFAQVGELGLLGVDVPEAYGGVSLGKKVSGLVAEKMGYGGSFSISFNIHAGVGTLPYVYYGTEEQKQRILPKLVSGEWIAGYALTEPNAGSDALQARTTAYLNDAGTAWILNGEKQWITNANIADVFVVFAKTTHGMTAFIVEKGVSGVSIGPEEKKMGIKGSSTATLLLEEVSIPVTNVLGELGKGHRVALNILNLARLKLAFGNIGTAKQALQLSICYGTTRQQFGKKLVEFTMIQEKIANMAVAIYASESSAYRTAGLLDDFLHSKEDAINELSKYAMECAINKVLSSEALAWIVDEAVQIHGGYGYMQEYEVERLYRDARISRIFEGTNEINRLTIARAMLKKTVEKEEIEMDENISRNEQFLYYSKQLFYSALEMFAKRIDHQLEQEQECLRLLADSIRDIYMMESVLIRNQKGREKYREDKEGVKQLMTDVLCEEGYRQVEAATISIISSLESKGTSRRAIVDSIRSVTLSMYSNLILSKRKIANKMINSGKYVVEGG
ncbi:acyl-CoA dehydrogenase family protein [Brevibacillus laterosporus]|uniref:Acyl-CoA dehydrogenase n=1 Tax=Brevibacillus laterosporus TaxID=1465 RepID=A0AAP8U4J4_BRELA|nr:acyl-CoA dehydrogenase family protein [Brevibacillus laterosporus]PPA93900.1 acyl-CoA dehydrogenase [Brevibacillus laterosporus]